MKITARVVVIVCLWGSWAGADYTTLEIFAGQFKQIIPVQGSGEAWMDPVTLSINKHGFISDIDVYLDITHSEVSDLWILLDAPQGDTIILKDDELMDHLWKNTPKQNMYSTIFDDEADLKLYEGIPPYSGRFRPAQGYSLSQFNGLDIYGDWTL
ncbi:proprotein convertase P-domain-containing protein, partial [Planctomycetota bacterium]